MIFEAVVVSFIVGILRSGNWLHFGVVKIKGITWIIAGGLLQLMVFRLAKADGIGLSLFLYEQFFLVHLMTYLMIFVPLLINPMYKSMYVIAFGTLLNMVVIFMNAGKMPVKLFEGMRNVSFDIGHTALTDHTALAFLSDIFYLRRPFPFPKIISVGDVFIIVGMFILIQQIMVNENLRRKLIKM